MNATKVQLPRHIFRIGHLKNPKVTNTLVCRIAEKEAIFVALQRKWCMNIAENLRLVREKLPASVKLLAVSKTYPAGAVQEAMEAGQTCFGESRVQELTAKQALFPHLEWHFIGHLQTNKVKQIVPFVSMIHSIDSERLLREINLHALKGGREVNCLLQVYIAREETKFGLDREELMGLLAQCSAGEFPGVRICGLMGMASNTPQIDVVRAEFRSLRVIFDAVKKQYYADKSYFCELSMGMSSDFALAVEEGSTMVRIGSAIFGHR